MFAAGTTLHAVQPFLGYRYSVVWFQAALYVPTDGQSTLAPAGFDAQKLEAANHEPLLLLLLLLLLQAAAAAAAAVAAAGCCSCCCC